MIWASLALSLVLQTESENRPQPGFMIHPRDCQNDYAFIEAVTRRLKATQEGKFKPDELDNIHDDLIFIVEPKFTVEPKPSKENTTPDWKKIKLFREDSGWKYEVTFIDGATEIVRAKSLKQAQTNFTSLWEVIASSKLEGEEGVLLQDCKLGNCRTLNGEQVFTPASSGLTPKPGPDVQYRLAIQGKDDKEPRLKFDLDQSYLGRRKSWFAQKKPDSNKRLPRSPYFDSEKICVLFKKSGSCDDENNKDAPKQASLPAVIKREQLSTQSDNFKKAENQFNEFTTNLHLDISEVLRTARAKKQIVVKPGTARDPSKK